jgi:hypothetical protein
LYVPEDKSPVPFVELGFLCFFERGDILYKVGTVKELAQFEKMMNRDLYREAMRIVKILDEAYGEGRDVDNADGGFVLVAENIQDVQSISQRYMKLDGNSHEVVDVLKCESGIYINAFFLHNNEFGVNILMPLEIAPSALLRDLPGKVTQY